MANNPSEFDLDSGDGMFPEETTEAAVERMLRERPEKHGVSIEERQRRAAQFALTRERLMAAGDEEERQYLRRCAELGLDPDATMGGTNKPRYTIINEAGDLKDHETGEVHVHQGETNGAAAEQTSSTGTAETGGAQPSERDDA